MSNLTEHFTKEEFERSETASRLGIKNNIPDDLLPNAIKVAQALETVRAHYGIPIYISSGYRSQDLNKATPGSSNSSAHCFAAAADFRVPGHENIAVCRELPSIISDFDQIIYEFGPSGWVHLGFRPMLRRQLLTAIKADGKTIYLPGIVEG